MSLTRRKFLKATAAAAAVTSLAGVEGLSSLGSKSLPPLQTAFVSNADFVVQPMYRYIEQLPIMGYLNLDFEKSVKNELIA
jgi:hypothetical protein